MSLALLSSWVMWSHFISSSLSNPATTESARNLTDQPSLDDNHDVWRHLEVPDAQLFTFSAIFDNRPLSGSRPVVRIQAYTSNATEQLRCYFLTDDFIQLQNSDVTKRTVGRVHRIQGAKYFQLQYTCRLPSNEARPIAVTMSTDWCCHGNHSFIPIHYPEHSDLAESSSSWTHTFGICVAATYGRLQPDIFVEWVEFYRMMGVTEIHMYNASVSSSNDQMFQYYVRHGVLVFHNVTIPVDDVTFEGVSLVTIAYFNDCMLRNMYRYKYLIVVDVDEFLVPRTTSNFTSLFPAIDAKEGLKEQWYSYTFRNTYYFDHFPQDTSQPSYLRTLRFRHRIKYSPFLYAGKSAVDPRRCLSLFNHHCWIRFPNTPSRWTIDVDPELARSHHYRKCGFKRQRCDNYIEKKMPDDITMRYKVELHERVSVVLKDLRI